MKPACPICRKKVDWEGNRFRPFCSERCRLVDLGRWAEGAYAFPTEESPETGGGEEGSGKESADDA